jgi:hypothetical protein
MRTGNPLMGKPNFCAASDCSISVCPGNSTPLSCKAFLLTGAVTTAATFPSKAAEVAERMAAAAIAPADVKADEIEIKLYH